MFFRKKRERVSFTMVIEPDGNIDFEFSWPETKSGLYDYASTLIALNRGMLAKFIALAIAKQNNPETNEIAKELKKVKINKLIDNGVPTAVIPPNKVRKRDLRRMNGEI